MADDSIRFDLGHGVEALTSVRDSILPYDVVTAHQVHGIRVAIIDRVGITREELEGYDALVTDLPVAIGIRTADCIPILLYDPVRRSVAAIHAGWRGTVQKIVNFTLEKMYEASGTEPKNLKAVIGPGISFENFQVGEEVPRLFKECGFPLDLIWKWDGSPVPGTMRGGHHIDLKMANRWLLEESGVISSNINVSEICTYSDCRLFSARREGTQCGRNINVIRLD